MNYDTLLNQPTIAEAQMKLRDRFRLRRKEQHISQQALSKKADVSLGSIKRFEATGEISLVSLIKLAYALGYEGDFEAVFAQKHYRNIQDVINDAKAR